MIRFHQTFGAHAGRTVAFEKDVVTIGRLPSCDIAFDARADIDASGQHAQVLREHGAWFVLDANSRNGTWLNGQRITRAQLTSGDELELGRGGPRLRVEFMEDVSTAPPKPDGGLLPTAQWTADEFQPPSFASGQAPAAAASVRQAPAAAASVRQAPVHLPTAPPPSNAMPNPTWRPPTERPVQRRGPALGVAIALGAIALVFSAFAVGVLVWKLRSASGSQTPPRPRLPPETAAAMLAATAGPATFLVAAHLPDGSMRPLCTAFAVRADLAATSGHCVKLVEQARVAGMVVDLLRPGSAPPVGVTALYLHPAFDPAVAGASPDVGVIRTAAVLTALVPLPTLDDLRAVAPGSAAYVVAYASAPSQGGTVPSPLVVAGTLGTPQHFDGSASDFEGAQSLPHSAPVERGGTGAPVLDDTGLLVAVHSSDALATPSLSVRADVLLALIAGLGA